MVCQQSKEHIILLEDLLRCSDCSLCCPIRLWEVWTACHVVEVPLWWKVLEFSRQELPPTVRHKCFWYSVMCETVFQFIDDWWSGDVGELGYVDVSGIIIDGNQVIASLHFTQVNSDPLERLSRQWWWQQWFIRLRWTLFQAMPASQDSVLNVSAHARPPHCLVCSFLAFPNAHVSIMDSLQDFWPHWKRDNDPVTLQEKSIADTQFISDAEQLSSHQPHILLVCRPTN